MSRTRRALFPHPQCKPAIIKKKKKKLKVSEIPSFCDEDSRLFPKNLSSLIYTSLFPSSQKPSASSVTFASCRLWQPRESL